VQKLSRNVLRANAREAEERSIAPFCWGVREISAPGTWNTGFPWWLSNKESACNAGATRDSGLIPGSGRSLGGGHGNLLQYSCLENPMNRGTWQTIAHRVTKSQTRLKQLSTQQALTTYGRLAQGKHAKKFLMGTSTASIEMTKKEIYT